MEFWHLAKHEVPRDIYLPLECCWGRRVLACGTFAVAFLKALGTKRMPFVFKEISGASALLEHVAVWLAPKSCGEQSHVLCMFCPAFTEGLELLKGGNNHVADPQHLLRAFVWVAAHAW